jgi:hypothetical protein
MRENDRRWMGYVDAELRGLCEDRGWGYQVRRKWSVRDRPVAESPVEDYEWKLISDAEGKLADHSPADVDEGTYYLLGLDPQGGRFLLQHDTFHAGRSGPHWQRQTFTSIHFAGPAAPSGVTLGAMSPSLPDPPPSGWLRGHLAQLTARFQPNHFSLT